MPELSARVLRTAAILKDAKFDGVATGEDHEKVVWSGDLNYRIDSRREQVIELMDQQKWSILMEHDQLIRQMTSNPLFGLRGFHEAPSTFAPTFKYDVGADRYDTGEKRRTGMV
ncbi:hypothetical protein HK104_011272 [Borealophlyctis nickersoniae]|nr:hypothetical protein HK104_011272 [Borealophlyctis nickersoniae]